MSRHLLYLCVFLCLRNGDLSFRLSGQRERALFFSFSLLFSLQNFFFFLLSPHKKKKSKRKEKRRRREKKKEHHVQRDWKKRVGVANDARTNPVLFYGGNDDDDEIGFFFFFFFFAVVLFVFEERGGRK